VRLALAEDAARSDHTTRAVVAEDAVGSGSIIFKEEGVLCGMPFVDAVFAELDERVVVKHWFEEGADIGAGSVVATVRGPVRAVLSGERTALNFLSLLSGIATETRALVRVLEPYGCRVYDTRKTHPGLREAEKYAVRVGGGHNHRATLAEALFVKDNHIRAAGGLEEALPRTSAWRAGLPLIVEVETVDEARRACAYAPDVLLCDNMSPEEIAAVLRIAGESIEVEASGGITPANAAAYAEVGVKRISTSAITMRARPIDVSLEIDGASGRA
jgi:nicotinate-nucleotide pyrophosphorylase (carboxylating)